MGGEIPDGVFAHTSNKKPLPLTELEKMLVWYRPAAAIPPGII